MEGIRRIFTQIDNFGFFIFYALFFLTIGVFLVFSFIIPTKMSNTRLIKILSKITYFVFCFCLFFIFIYFALFFSWLKMIFMLPLFIVYLVLMWKLKKEWHLPKSEKRNYNVIFYGLIIMFILGLMNLVLTQI